MHAPFTVVEPTTEESPLLVEVPHAGLSIDAEALAWLAAPGRSIGRDADLYVDQLYARAPAHGATLLVAHASRYVVDLNRSEADLDAESVEGVPSSARATRGVVWRLTSDGGRALVRPLPRAEFIRRLDTYYRPYHRTLAAIVERKRERFGFAVVLAAHSMPSVARTDALPQRPRADVVPGTRGRSSSSRVFIDGVEDHARAFELSVAHDDPYQGGFTTQHYGQPARGVHVVQVELARRLYMDETSLAKHHGFEGLEAWCEELTAKLGRLRPAR